MDRIVDALRASPMYKVNFCHNMGPTYLVKSPTMYEVNLRIMMGPTYAIGVPLCIREKGEINYFLLLVETHKLVGHP